MPSSTSSSDNRIAGRAIVALLAVLFFYCLGIEIVTRLGFSRISEIQRRIYHDLKIAKSIAPRVPNQPPTILVVGNSLLLEGVNRESLEKDLAPNYLVDLLPIENTQYEDWYFGLRRLFIEGARPSIVVICLSTRHMMSPATNGEYFAHYLMQEQDLLRVKRKLKLDNTMTSAYFFANRSVWLGSRAEIRNWLALRIMPNLPQLISYFPAKTLPMPEKEEVIAKIIPRLLELDLLCRSNGARLVVVVPPTLSPEDASQALRDSAAGDGISVLVPLRANDVSPDDFRDRFHMNPHGAARFTPRLASALLQTLNGNQSTF